MCDFPIQSGGNRLNYEDILAWLYLADLDELIV